MTSSEKLKNLEDKLKQIYFSYDAVTLEKAFAIAELFKEARDRCIQTGRIFKDFCKRIDVHNSRAYEYMGLLKLKNTVGAQNFVPLLWDSFSFCQIVYLAGLPKEILDKMTEDGFEAHGEYYNLETLRQLNCVELKKLVLLITRKYKSNNGLRTSEPLERNFLYDN